jgi:hypothetical protein
MVAERRTHGFWKGLLVGLLVAAAGLLALAWLYPPRPLIPPEVDPGALQAPAAPGQPDGAASLAPAGTGAAPAPRRETAREAPKIADAPASESAPDPME